MKTLKQARKESSMTRAELARAMRDIGTPMTAQTVAYYEGLRGLPTIMALRFGDVLGCEIETKRDVDARRARTEARRGFDIKRGRS